MPSTSSTSTSTSPSRPPTTTSIQTEASHTFDPSLHVKPVPLPNTSLINIEYPGIIAPDPPSTRNGLDPLEYSPLDMALSTFHPSSLSPETSSSHSALEFLSRIPNHGLKVIECRLGSFGKTPQAAATASLSSPPNDTAVEDMYKSPLIGEAVSTHNIVIRITKRTWRKKKTNRTKQQQSDENQIHDGDDITTDSDVIHQGKGKQKATDEMELDPALFQPESSATRLAKSTHLEDEPMRETSRYTGESKREYKVEVVGIATKTVRFRSMADFAYKPDIYEKISAKASPTASGGTQKAGQGSQEMKKLDPVIELHAALARMDLQVLKRWEIPEQLEDYEVEVGDGNAKRSNLRMLPPAFFSRADIPFNYNFQQTTYSELRTVPRPPHMSKLLQPLDSFSSIASNHDTSNDSQMQRFVNKVRLSNIAPQPFRLGKDSRIPLKPSVEVLRIESRCDPAVLDRLRQLLDERPIWSRLAFKNQLSQKEVFEMEGTNGKVYFALVGYAMVGGPWRDTIVRLGYDARVDKESRIYQRIFIRSKRDWAVPPSTTTTAATSTSVIEQDMMDESSHVAGGDGDPPESPESLRRIRKPYPAANRPDPSKLIRSAGALTATATTSSLAQNPTSSSSTLLPNHIFDGSTHNRSIGNFQLCDIQDPLILPFIHQTEALTDPTDSSFHIPWLRNDGCDDESGWYTKRALELIRALVAARFKSLVDSNVALPCQMVYDIVDKFKCRWKEEDQQQQS